MRQNALLCGSVIFLAKGALVLKEIIKGAEAFLLPGGKKGALLIHGFMGSPAEMRLLGDALNEKGFTVLGVRLPGHGTDVAELETTRARDWLGACVDGFDLLKAITDDVAAVGLSMGAILALLLSERRSVSHLVTISAPIFIAESEHLDRLPPVEEAVGQFLPRPKKKIEGVGAQYTTAYDKMPLRSLHELLFIMDEAKKLLPKITVPLLAAQGLCDHTVLPESAEYIVKTVNSTKKELLLLPKSGHRATLLEQRDELFAKTAAFLLG